MIEQTSASELFRGLRIVILGTRTFLATDVQLQQGHEVYTGIVRINRDLSVEVTGIKDEQVHLHPTADVVTHANGRRLNSLMEKPV